VFSLDICPECIEKIYPGFKKHWKDPAASTFVSHLIGQALPVVSLIWYGPRFTGFITYLNIALSRPWYSLPL
jgi:hypothetical protein